MSDNPGHQLNTILGARDGPTVSVKTLDEILATLAIPRVDLLKMNIEGAELQALAGFSRGLPQTPVRCDLLS